MIKIYKDDEEKIVTMGAYENLYKSMGFKIVGTNSSKQVTEQVIENKEPIYADTKVGFDNKDNKENKDVKGNK